MSSLVIRHVSAPYNKTDLTLFLYIFVLILILLFFHTFFSWQKVTLAFCIRDLISLDVPLSVLTVLSR